MRRPVEWAGAHLTNSAVAMPGNTRLEIVSATELDAYSHVTVMNLTGSLSIRINDTIPSSEPAVSNVCEYWMGIGLFHEDLTAAEIDALRQDNDWLWTACGVLEVMTQSIPVWNGSAITYEKTLIDGSAKVRNHEVRSRGRRKVRDSQELSLVISTNSVADETITDLRVTAQIRALLKE